ncbi:hypothetical protein E4U58_003723 [Claviceps cyperi]|nr:hypothetical protein E4U58_003723 [Claviceps cyperi]
MTTNYVAATRQRKRLIVCCDGTWMNSDCLQEYEEEQSWNKPEGLAANGEYRSRLEKLGLTRVYQNTDHLITVKAIGVWDTVGSLDIPEIPWLEKLGV